MSRITAQANYTGRGFLLLTFGAFMVPPMVFMPMLYCCNLFTVEQIMQLAMGPVLNTYVLLYGGAMMFLTWKRVRFIRENSQAITRDNLEPLQKAINGLPTLVLFGLIGYNLFGPATVMYGHDFVSWDKFFWAYSLAFPVAVGGFLPFLVPMIMYLERMNRHVPVSEKYCTWNFEKRVYWINLAAMGCTAAAMLLVTRIMFVEGNLGAGQLASGFWGLCLLAGLLLFANALPVYLLFQQTKRQLLSGIQESLTVAEGGIPHKIEPLQRDEVGALTAALNEVADKLDARITLTQRVARGDLTRSVEVGAKGDIWGQALQSMVGNLRQMLHQVAEASEAVSTRSEQVSDASQTLSQGATEQAASIEEISSSLQEFEAQSKTTAENASEANTLTNDATEAAQRGSRQMTQMVDSMHRINENATETRNVIRTIDDIAFQTNLLALNAAVEAARAGQHGKGFAVVAEEVRNLASRSAKAAEETASLIDRSNKEIEQGVALTQETAQSLEAIGDQVSRALTLVTEIAGASEEQARGIGQITEGVDQVSAVTQQNTAAAEETASASEEMLDHARSLNELAGRFQFERGAGEHGRRNVARIAQDLNVAEAALRNA